MAKEDIENTEENADPSARGEEPPSSPLLAVLNSIALVTALGAIIYTRVIYKHPVITDSEEKIRILSTKTTPVEPYEGVGTLSFGPLTINILSATDNTLPVSRAAPLVKGKMHYLQTAFTLEIRNKSQIELVESKKPLILDKLIQYVGKKTFQELATVQGRYILHSQLINVTNQAIIGLTNDSSKEQLVTNLYFTTFLVQ